MARKSENSFSCEGNTTPVIEIEAIESKVSTPGYKDNEIDLINLINMSDAKYNCKHFINKVEVSTEECKVEVYVKIDNFRFFLDNKLEYETESFDFYLPKFDFKLISKISLMPADEKFSIKIEFEEDKKYTKNNRSEVCDINSISSDPKQMDLNSFCVMNGKNKKMKKSPKENIHENEETDLTLDLLYSEELKNVLNKNEVNIDINIGLFSHLKKIFAKNKKEKFKLNSSSCVFLEEYYDYDDLVYEKLVDPFLIKFKLSALGKSRLKCDEFNGLVNEGNTCYLNSIIQSIFHLKILRRAIFNIPSNEESPVFSFQKILHSLQTEKSSVKTSGLFKSFGWEKSFWNSQQDVQEIFSFIFDIVSSQEKNYLEDQAQLAHLCEGMVKSEISCLDIEYKSEINEKFLFLQLDIENCDDLFKCIEKFLSVEYLLGENRYETADLIKHDAMRSFRFSKIPEILLVQLKRFKCEGNDIIKMHQRVEYPDNLELSNYYSTKVNELVYSLYGVIVHKGTINSGHYYAYLKDFNQDKWIEFNDTKVHYASEQDVFEKNFGGYESSLHVTKEGEVNYLMNEIEATAYILIYVQKDKIKSLFRDVTKNEIPESLIEMLNTSKRTKANNVNQMQINAYYPPNNLKGIGNGSKQGINSTLSCKNGKNTSNENINYKTKIKSQERTDISNRNSSKGRAKIDSKHIIKQVLNNRVENDFLSKISIVIESPSNASSFRNKTSNSNQTSDKVKMFIKKNPQMVRKFSFKFIENSTNSIIKTSNLEKTLDKKLTALGLIDECIFSLQNINFERQAVKLVELTNMGMFLRIVDESEDIMELLDRYHKKETYLCFYILDMDIILNTNVLIIALHLYKENFDSDNQTEVNIHYNTPGWLKPPVVFRDEKMLINEQKFKETVSKYLNELYNKSSQHQEIKIIDLTEDAVKQINKFTSVKLRKISNFEFIHIITQKINTEVLRIAVDSDIFF